MPVERSEAGKPLSGGASPAAQRSDKEAERQGRRTPSDRGAKLGAAGGCSWRERERGSSKRLRLDLPSGFCPYALFRARHAGGYRSPASDVGAAWTEILSSIAQSARPPVKPTRPTQTQPLGKPPLWLHCASRKNSGAVGDYLCPEARQTLGGRERSERARSSRGRGDPARPRGATAREEPRAPRQPGRARSARGKPPIN